MNFRNKKLTRLVVLGAGLALVVGATILFADLGDLLTGTIFDEIFELGPDTRDTNDGGNVTNILGSASVPGPDWSDIMVSTGSTQPGGDDRTPATPRGSFAPGSFGGTGAFVTDDASAGGFPDLTTYVGTGNKNSDPVSSWTYSTNAIPSKDDITNAYTYTKTVTGASVPLPGGGSTTQHKLIFVGIEREVASGDSHLDIEFFQQGLGLSVNPPCPKNCTFTGSNTNGDILVNMDFVIGGGLGSVTIRRRDEGVTNNYDLVGGLAPKGKNTAEGCNAVPSILGGGATGDVCGFNDGGPISTGGWTTFDAHLNASTNLDTNEFTEIGFDVTGLGLGAPCLATVEVKSRSSQSFTSSLKDFALHSFEACVPTIRTEIHTGNPSTPPTDVSFDPTDKTVSGPLDIQGGSIDTGTTIHDQALVRGVLGVASPSGSVTFSLFFSSDCSNNPGKATIVYPPATLYQVFAPTATEPGISAADSPAITPSPGALSYRAVYSATAPYTGTVISGCESLTVNQLPSTVVTQIQQGTGDVTNSAITNGGTVHDVAFVYGCSTSTATNCNVPNRNGIDPTGTVTFTVYGSANCTGSLASIAYTQGGVPTTANPIVVTAPTSANNNDRLATWQTPDFSMPNAATTGQFICIQAAYGGDTNYLPSQPSQKEPICAFTPVTEPFLN